MLPSYLLRNLRAVSACSSGLLLALCFPNFSILPLLPVALIPLVAALDGAKGEERGLFGYAFGLVFWIVTIPWIAYTVHRFGGVSWPVAGLALALAAAICAVPFAVMGALYAWVAPRSAAGIVATFGAAWVVQELFRSTLWIFGGFPWALLANPLADVPQLLGTAALGGVFLSSLLLAALNAALFVALTRRARNLRLAWLAGAALAAVIAGAAGPGRPRASGDLLRVGVVQPNVPQDLRWEAGTADRLFADLEDQTRGLCRHGRPVLVLWPESAAPYAWSFAPAFRDRVVALCKELDIAILLSTVWSDAPADPDAPFYNAALLVTKDGPGATPLLQAAARALRRVRAARRSPSEGPAHQPRRAFRFHARHRGDSAAARDLEARGRRVLRGRLPLDRARGGARGSRRPVHAHERRVVRPRRRAAAALAVGRRARDRDGPPARPRGDHGDQRSRRRDGHASS